LPAPLRTTPDSAFRSWARGRQAMDEGRYAEAAAELERALAQDPRLWPACHSLAVAEVMLHDRPAVEQTVERCRRIFPFPYLTAEKLLGARG
jgi:Tfp pilus assembly protein PilF